GPGRMGGCGVHVGEVVGEHPVLLGGQLEVLDAGHHRVVVGDVDGVGQVVVRLSPGPLLSGQRRVGGELPADQVQVVRGCAEGVGDAAVPAGQACAVLHGGAQAGELVTGDRAHRPALHDQ